MQFHSSSAPPGSASHGLQWRTQPRTAASATVIDIRQEILNGFSIKHDETMKLTIKSIGEEHSGRYYCKKRATYLSSYDITGKF